MKYLLRNEQESLTIDANAFHRLMQITEDIEQPDSHVIPPRDVKDEEAEELLEISTTDSRLSSFLFRPKYIDKKTAYLLYWTCKNYKHRSFYLIEDAEGSYTELKHIFGNIKLATLKKKIKKLAKFFQSGGFVYQIAALKYEDGICCSLPDFLR